MALKASEIKEYMNTHILLPENISRMLLDLEDLLVYDVDYGTRDLNEPIYIYCTPNNRVICPDTSGQPVCPHCGSLLSHVQQYEDRSIDDTPREHRRTVLEILYVTRLCLDCHRIYSPRLLCAKPKARCSNRHNAAIVEETFNKKSFKQVAYDFHVSNTYVESQFKQECARRKESVQLSAVPHLGIDETKVHTKDKQKRMCVVLLDTAGRPSINCQYEYNRLVALEQTKLDAQSITDLLTKLDQPEIVETVTMDMSSSFRAAVQTALPAARIIVDRFHLVQSLNDKTKKVATAIYEAEKERLQQIAKIEIDTSLYEGTTDAIPQQVEDAGREQIAKGLETQEPQPQEIQEAKEKLACLIRNYNNKRFGCNRGDLSADAMVKMQRLFKVFPEFENLYKIKETMRDMFFEARTKEEAMKIAERTEKLIPTRKLYGPLRTYFKTLNRSEWTPYIYDYFTEPIGQRYTNAALEGINSYIKDVNRESRGLTWEALHDKILFGRTSVRQRPKRFSHNEVQMMFEKALRERRLPNGVKMDHALFALACQSCGAAVDSTLHAVVFTAFDSELLYDDPSYNQNYEIFIDALYRYHVFRATETEPVEVFDPFPLKLILSHKDLLVGITIDDASDLKQHSYVEPFDTAEEWCQNAIWGSPDRFNDLMP